MPAPVVTLFVDHARHEHALRFVEPVRDVCRAYRRQCGVERVAVEFDEAESAVIRRVPRHMPKRRQHDLPRTRRASAPRRPRSARIRSAVPHARARHRPLRDRGATRRASCRSQNRRCAAPRHRRRRARDRRRSARADRRDRSAGSTRCAACRCRRNGARRRLRWRPSAALRRRVRRGCRLDRVERLSGVQSLVNGAWSIGCEQPSL